MQTPAVVEQIRRRAVGGGAARRDVILELDLTEPVMTVPPADPIAALRARRRTTLASIIDGLAKAAHDDTVAAVVAKLGPAPGGLGIVQELREAILAFKVSGKRTIAWAETFGEMGPGTAGYYLATAFGEIWLQESGDVGLIGLQWPAQFVNEALEKLDLEPQIGQRHEYKNFANMFMERGFTDAHREAVGRLVDSAGAQIVDAVAAARGLQVRRVHEIIDRAPLTAAAAKDAGLVDHIGYRDEVYAAIGAGRGETAEDNGEEAADASTGGESEQAADGDERPKLVYLGRYGNTPRAAIARKLAARKERSIAVVYAAGGITLGRSGHGPTPGGGSTAGADTVGAAIRAAVRDDNVGAIVFRVDSPGGSYVASDSIRREVVRAREQGIPVVVSMGDVAGSGGYFIAMAADAILASPATITGSIGVLGGKIVTQGLFDRLGVRRDGVQFGARSAMFTTRAPFDEEQWQALQGWLDRVYDDFTVKVARDRKLPREHVHDVARGRIWTGADAKERGLVDELGGLADAVRLARSKAELPARSDFDDVHTYPRVPPIERLRPPSSSESPAAWSSRIRLAAWGPFARVAAELGLPAEGPLTVPGAAATGFTLV
ncbi:MAG: signal peptide peptidase SppA [Mycobacteriales bacterium]